jgi:glycosyltransferase involved in cell wall biosynthesis
VEGFGLTVVEALAAGVPVVAPRTPVYTAMGLEQFGGVLYNDSDRALTKALQEVIAKAHKTGETSHSAPPPSLSPPAGPIRPSPAVLTHLQNHFSIPRMVELHEEFFKNF